MYITYTYILVIPCAHAYAEHDTVVLTVLVMEFLADMYQTLVYSAKLVYEVHAFPILHRAGVLLYSCSTSQ
jgi:hypothetical protein